MSRGRGDPGGEGGSSGPRGCVQYLLGCRVAPSPCPQVPQPAVMRVSDGDEVSGDTVCPCPLRVLPGSEVARTNRSTQRCWVLQQRHQLSPLHWGWRCGRSGRSGHRAEAGVCLCPIPCFSMCPGVVQCGLRFTSYAMPFMAVSTAPGKTRKIPKVSVGCAVVGCGDLS